MQAVSQILLKQPIQYSVNKECVQQCVRRVYYFKDSVSEFTLFQIHERNYTVLRANNQQLYNIFFQILEHFYQTILLLNLLIPSFTF